MQYSSPSSLPRCVLLLISSLFVLQLLVGSTAWQCVHVHADAAARPFSADASRPHFMSFELWTESKATMGHSPFSFAEAPVDSSVPEVIPSAVWSPSYVNGLLYASGALYVTTSRFHAVANTLLRVDPSSHVVLANATFLSSLSVTQLVASASFIWAVGVNQSDLSVYVMKLGPTALNVVHLQQMPYNLRLLGVDQSEQLLLTSVSGSDLCVWYNATDGSRVGVLRGGGQLAVQGGVIDRATQHVLIADHNTRSIVVVDPSNDSIIATMPYDSTDRSLIWGSMSVDEGGRYLYARYTVSNITSGSSCSAIVAYNLLSYTQITAACLTQPLGVIPRLVSAGRQPLSIYLDVGSSNVQLYSLASNSTVDSIEVGEYPAFSYPSAIATHAGELVHIATNVPLGFVTVNSSGQLVGPAVLLDQATLDATCKHQVWQSVSVDHVGNVWLPICNGTIAVFDGTAQLLRRIELTNNTVPFAIAPSLSAESFYSIDAMDPFHITEYNSSSGDEIRVFGEGELAGFWDVGVAADGTIWATNYQPAYIYRFAPNGTVLSFWNMSAYQPGAINILLHIAPDTSHNQVLVTHQLLGRGNQIENHVLWLDLATGATTQQFTIDPSAGFNANIGVPRGGTPVYAASMTYSTVYVFNQTQPLREEKHEDRHSKQRDQGITL